MTGLSPGRREMLASLRRTDSWFTFALITLVCVTLAWSLDDALLVLGRDEVTDFLVWAAVGGVIAGALGPLVGWGRWTSHVVGASFAALVVALFVGGVLVGDGATPATMFQATTDAVVGAWSDLVLAGRRSTVEYGHHLLVLGLLMWGTAQFASHAAFGHRRPIHGIVVVGLLLIANMSLTLRSDDQLIFLVLYSVASLFLLVRFHTMDEQTEWVRRRIGDPARDLGDVPARRDGLHHRGHRGFAAAHLGRDVRAPRRRMVGRRVAGRGVGPVPRALPARLADRPVARPDVRWGCGHRHHLEHG